MSDKIDPKLPAVSEAMSPAQIVKLFAEAIKSAQPTAGMLTGMSEERLERVQGKHDKPIRYRLIPGRSQETGATFVQHVVESRAFPTGRVVRIESYRHPDDAYVPQSSGGRMPDGLRSAAWSKEPGGSLTDDTPNNALSVPFKQWRYEAFWKADIQGIVGKALRAENCVDGADAFKVPWETAVLFQDESMAAE
jgi:hypothetical protein